MYIPESITFINCQCNVFWPYVAIIIAAAITKGCSYRNNCGFRLHHAGDLQHVVSWKEKIGLHMFLFSVLCSAIPDLDLEVLKMLIRVCFCDVLQPRVYWFVPSMIWNSASLYSKCTVFTVNLCYFQVLARYKKVLS